MIAALNKKTIQFAFFAGIFILFLLLAVYTGQYFFITAPFFILFFYVGWQQVNIVFFLLLFSLPFSFEYHFSSTLGTDIPDELLMLLVAGFFFTYLLWFPQNLPVSVWRHPLMIFFFVYLCWLILTVFFSSNILVSSKYLLAKGWYTGAFVLAPLIIFNKKRNIQTTALLLAFAMLLVTIISLLRHSFTGFSFAGINNAVTPFFRNHVNYSAMLVCTIPLFLAFYGLNKQRKIRSFILIIICILLIALFFSYARGAWLALAAGLATYRLIRKKILVGSYIAALSIVCASLFWIKSNDRYLKFANDYNTTIFHQDFREHLIATYKLKDVSTAERFYRWIAGVRMIKDNGLTGYGPNTFYDHYKEYAVPAFKTWVSKNEDHSTVHNYFLLLAIEQGIPGLIFFLILLGAMLYYAQHLYHRVKDLFYKTVAITTGVILVMIITVNFLSDLIETDKIGSLFFLCLAALIVTDRSTRKEMIDDN